MLRTIWTREQRERREAERAAYLARAPRYVRWWHAVSPYLYLAEVLVAGYLAGVWIRHGW